MTTDKNAVPDKNDKKNGGEAGKKEPWYMALWEVIGFKVPALVIIGGILGVLGTSLYFKDHPWQDINLLVEATLAARPTATSAPSATPQPPSLPSATQPPTTYPAFHLSAIGFITGNWKPRMVDLRAAETVGIHPQKDDNSLGLFDLRVAAPDDLQGKYLVQAEVYASDGTFIGRTKRLPLVARETQLGDVNPTNYIHDTIPNTWRIQAGWEYLTVQVNLYEETGEEVLAANKQKIKLSPTETTAWWIAPPSVAFSVIVYQINNGEKSVLDLRTAETKGLQLKMGDTLKIWEIWYRSMSDGEPKETDVFGEIYAGPKGEYVNGSNHLVSAGPIKEGTYNLLGNDPFVWENLPQQSWLVLNITRRDYEGIERSTLLDRLEISLVK